MHSPLHESPRVLVVFPLRAYFLGIEPNVHRENKMSIKYRSRGILPEGDHYGHTFVSPRAAAPHITFHKVRSTCNVHICHNLWLATRFFLYSVYFLNYLIMRIFTIFVIPPIESVSGATPGYSTIALISSIATGIQGIFAHRD